ncbi:crotonase/enoyl-CoA hydratase family protein [uncultured Cohaesibacter sp.]|uniref:crotonase/enoyl-CoA hydratase family protein n=1 Tax=uncultured Cohaesibacter sp. TaxID=1002546 RepID=UPI0029C6B0AF|nr:crotonase/enoyl-CoA hydratase family protein [uncultured Cohaesibacter sp.]
MTFETIRIDRQPNGTATVTLARPDKHNAMNEIMIAELAEAAGQLTEDSSVRVIILAGEGKSFCAGGDLGWMKRQMENDRQEKMREAGALASMLNAWNGLLKPVIGKVHGAAYGGGLGLVAVCDVVVAAEDCRFALTETRLGLIPATIGPFVVSRMGEAFARQVFFNARPFDAAFLMRAGLVSLICKTEELDETVSEEAAFFLDCAPGAIADAKSLCRALAGCKPQEMANFTAGALADRWETDEAQEGIAAFFAKSLPSWRR